MSDYRYLFPYEKIPAMSRILIYGAGILGQEYLKQMLITNYCKVVGFVDRNYLDYPTASVPVYAPERIHELAFDYVVIALRDGFGVPAIRQILSEQGVDTGKVVCIFERANENPVVFQHEDGIFDHTLFAYQTKFLSIAFYMAGGFGDMICHKLFVMEILRLASNVRIDIYATKDEDYLKWLYAGCDQIQNIMLDLGSRYFSNQESYDLSISIYGAKFLQVDWFNTERLAKEGGENFAHRVELLHQATGREGIGHPIPGAVAYWRRIFRGENCRTWFNFGGIFSVKDESVSIPVFEEDEKEIQNLGVKKFITVNVGNGSAKNGGLIAKTWPVEWFERTIEWMKGKYQSVSVVQVGAADEERLENADFYLMGKKFGVVACALKQAIFHLDIEGGLVHLATHLGTKCIVLFGPTPMKYFAYPQNINVRVGDCHDCAGLYQSVDACARRMKKPACMYAITPEIVMAQIEKYMAEIGLEDKCVIST